jgi:hypothetical protein
MVCVKKKINPPGRGVNGGMASLPFVFAFFDLFEDGKTGLFGVGNREGLEFMRGAETGDDFADGLFARRTLGQCGGAQGPLEGELPATGLAFAFAQLVFV